MINLYFNCFIEEYRTEKIYNKISFNFHEKEMEDNKKNLWILKATLFSYSLLNIKSAVFNIELDKCFTKEDEHNLKNFIEKIFINSNLDINFSRPNRIEQWIDDSNKIEDFFDNSPVLYTYNHDHIFSGANVSLFHEIIYNFNKIKKNNINNALCISHHPEFNSLTYNLKNFENRFNKQNMLFNFSDLDKKENFYVVKAKNHIDGVFMASKQFSKYMWSKAKNAYGDPYVPRPDHHTVILRDFEFDMWIQSEELFRHFEGYNHVTSLLDYDFSFVALNNNDVINLYCSKFTKEDKYQPYILKKLKNNNNNVKNLNLSNEAQYILAIYFIAFRDYVFNQLFISKKTIDTKKFVRQILNHYFGSNLTLINIAENNKIQLYREILLNLNENLHKFVNDCLLLVGNSDDFMSIGSISLREKLTNLNDKKDEDQKKKFFS